MQKITNIIHISKNHSFSFRLRKFFKNPCLPFSISLTPVSNSQLQHHQKTQTKTIQFIYAPIQSLNPFPTAPLAPSLGRNPNYPLVIPSQSKQSPPSSSNPLLGGSSGGGGVIGALGAPHLQHFSAPRVGNTSRFREISKGHLN